MKCKTIVCSSVGKKRKINQDNFFASGKINAKFKTFVMRTFKKVRTERTYAVCDGMGGEKYGEIAALICVKLLDKYIKKYKKLFEKFDEHVQCYITNANKALCKVVSENGKGRMGSTVAMLCIAPERASAILANVGDTKVLLYRNGELERISEDHNEAQSLVNMGMITEEEARTHKDKSKLTQHLGIFSNEIILEPYISDYIPIYAGDVFLICSDGLTDMLSYTEIKDILVSEKKLKKAVKRLIAKANERGGNDNITVVASAIIK